MKAYRRPLRSGPQERTKEARAKVDAWFTTRPSSTLQACATAIGEPLWRVAYFASVTGHSHRERWLRVNGRAA